MSMDKAVKRWCYGFGGDLVGPVNFELRHMVHLDKEYFYPCRMHMLRVLDEIDMPVLDKVMEITKR